MATLNKKKSEKKANPINTCINVQAANNIDPIKSLFLIFFEKLTFKNINPIIKEVCLVVAEIPLKIEGKPAISQLL